MSKDLVTEHRILRGDRVRERILSEVAAYVSKQGSMGRIVSVSIGVRPETTIYVRNQAVAAARVKLPFTQELWSADVTLEECLQLLEEMNDDRDILGVILQRPVPEHINLKALQAAIHPLKDIEGMNPASIGNIVYNDVAMAPCTAAAAVELLRETGLPLPGLEVVMIGHSEIVGKPVAMMLMAEGATVTVCHHMTRSVAMHSRRADVVLVAVGKAHLVGPEMIKPGAAVIDIGINQVVVDRKTRIVGDVDTAAVRDTAGWITPVPGGVGPVTVAILMRNAMIAHSRQTRSGWRDGGSPH